MTNNIYVYNSLLSVKGPWRDQNWLYSNLNAFRTKVFSIHFPQAPPLPIALYLACITHFCHLPGPCWHLSLRPLTKGQLRSRRKMLFASSGSVGFHPGPWKQLLVEVTFWYPLMLYWTDLWPLARRDNWISGPLTAFAGWFFGCFFLSSLQKYAGQCLKQMLANVLWVAEVSLRTLAPGEIWAFWRTEVVRILIFF